MAPQATGHNQGALGEMDGTLLLNVSRLQEVRVDPGAQQVRVGAGVKWDRVAPRLSAHGLAGLHGSSPDVGIAGYSLGGGMGWLARKYGLQANAVTALELVTAEGELVRADDEHHSDLFWALRGGGGNFGVVTAIEFAVHPVDELYAGALFFPFERASEVLHAWSAWQADMPEELMSWVSLLHFPPIPRRSGVRRGRSFAVVMAAFLGEEPEGVRCCARCASSARSGTASPPSRRWCSATWRWTRSTRCRFTAGTRCSTSCLPRRSTLSSTQWARVRAAARRSRCSSSGRWAARSRARPPVRASGPRCPARQHVHARCGHGRGRAAEVNAAVADVENAVLPHRAGHYPNFVEKPADASAFFAPEAWARLREIKARYDGDDLFRGNHHIPAAES